MKRILMPIKLLAMLWLCSASLSAAVLYVKPGSTSTVWSTQTNVYTDLQAALAAASYGDQIWLAAGTYKPTIGKDRSISFNLKNGVAIYGGFVGTETLLNQRNWVDNSTILSGDIGDGGVDIDNTFIVVRASGTSNAPLGNTTRIDGVVIEKGYCDSNGGGLLLNYANIVAENMHFRNNYASFDGGAVFSNQSNAQFVNSLFIANKAIGHGGAVYTVSPLSFVNCTFTNNRSENVGGAVFSYSSTPTIINSIAWGNSAKNSSHNIGGVTCTYSCIEGGYTGTGNISNNPLFVDAANGDYRLVSTSPCINTGLSSAIPAWLTKDFYGSNRLVGTAVDMGLYEYEFSVPTSLQSTKALSQQTAMVYPNAINKGEVFQIKFLEFVTEAKISLFDVSGTLKVQDLVTGVNNYSFTKTNFAPGIYILEVVEANNRTIVKVVIK